MAIGQAVGLDAGIATDEPTWRKWLPIVLLFLLIYIISYIDRQILSLVVQPVKAALSIGDFEIGLLQGFAFTLVLAVAALLASPLVDKGNRVVVLGICMLIWCMMTILCGLAQNFEMLLVARTGLAIAEAVVPMAVMSIICDVAPRASVARASALFMSAPYVGSGFALLVGGPLLALLGNYEGQVLPIIGPLEPWRGLFFALGFPGIILALLVLMFLREPLRQTTAPKRGSDEDALVPFLKDNASFLVPMLLANAMLNLIGYTIYAWAPTFMIRVHGMSPASVGVTVGTIFVIAGICGCIFGGWVMSRCSAQSALSHVVRTIGLLFLCLSVPLVAFPMVGDTSLALALLGIAFFLLASALSSIMTPVALFAPSQLRGRALAAAGLCFASIGGLGPLAVGAVNDFVFQSPGSIGDSLFVTFAVACGFALTLTPRVVRLARTTEAAQSSAGP